MANKPVIDSSASKPFDMNNGKLIKYTWDGGGIIPDTVRFRILNPKTEKVLHIEEQDFNSYTFTIAAGGYNVLVNGSSYLVDVQVEYTQNETTIVSDFSEKVIIYCYSAPTMELTGLPETNPIEITQPSVTIGINYTQGENDDLNAFNYVLYDSNKIELLASQTFTNKNKQYSFYGLEDNKVYYLRANGVSIHGQLADTGYVEINVNLSGSGSSSLLEVKNNKCYGNIYIATNIDTQGYYNERSFVVDDPLGSQGDYILDASNGYIAYNEGVLIRGDFSSKVTFRSPTPNDRVIYFKDGNNIISVRYMVMKDWDNITPLYAYFLLEVMNNGVVNDYATEHFTPLDSNTTVDLALSRKKESYQEGDKTRYYNSYSIHAKIGGVIY